MVRSVGELAGLLLLLLAGTRRVHIADPTVDREVLLLRWDLRARVADLLDGDGAAFRCRLWRLLLLLLLMLAVQVKLDVGRGDILRQRVTIVDDVVGHRPALVRGRSVLRWIVPQDGPAGLMSTRVGLGRQVNALRLSSVLVVVRLWDWRAAALDAFVVGSIRSVSWSSVVPRVHRQIAKREKVLKINFQTVPGNNWMASGRFVLFLPDLLHLDFLCDQRFELKEELMFLVLELDQLLFHLHYLLLRLAQSLLAGFRVLLLSSFPFVPQLLFLCGFRLKLLLVFTLLDDVSLERDEQLVLGQLLVILLLLLLLGHFAEISVLGAHFKGFTDCSFNLVMVNSLICASKTLISLNN